MIAKPAIPMTMSTSRGGGRRDGEDSGSAFVAASVVVSLPGFRWDTDHLDLVEFPVNDMMLTRVKTEEKEQEW